MLQSRQIEAFRAVVTTGSMTAAAQHLRITQPAVSRLIRDLEIELGLALFQRRGTGITLTQDGRALAGEVDRSFIGLGRIDSFARKLRVGHAGTLKIAALPAMANAFLPRFLTHFCGDYPEISIILEGLPSSQVREQVADGLFDVGVSAAPMWHPGLKSKLIDGDAVVAVPKDHRLSGVASISPQDFEGENIIRLSKIKSNFFGTENLFSGISYSQTFEVTLGCTACAFVEAGAGLAIVDPFSASEFLNRGIVLKPFQPRFAIASAVIWSRNLDLSALTSTFVEKFSNHCRQYIDDLFEF